MRQTHRLLIIDDSREIVSALKAFFERKYEVITAHDGIEGLLVLEQNENFIDLVISDLLMPELNGFGLISIVKRKYPRIPIIAITGWKGNIEATGVSLCADQILEKPFSLLDLDKSIEKVLSAISS